MAEIGDHTCQLKPFKSAVTPSSDTDPARDVELMRTELERYLKQLKDAVCADLTEARDRIEALEVVVGP